MNRDDRDDEDLFVDDLETYRSTLSSVTGATYPINTLRRRVAALTKSDRAKIQKLEGQLMTILNKMDDVISARADVNDDPWP